MTIYEITSSAIVEKHEAERSEAWDEYFSG